LLDSLLQEISEKETKDNQNSKRKLHHCIIVEFDK